MNVNNIYPNVVSSEFFVVVVAVVHSLKKICIRDLNAVFSLNLLIFSLVHLLFVLLLQLLLRWLHMNSIYKTPSTTIKQQQPLNYQQLCVHINKNVINMSCSFIVLISN